MEKTGYDVMKMIIVILMSHTAYSSTNEQEQCSKDSDDHRAFYQLNWEDFGSCEYQNGTNYHECAIEAFDDEYVGFFWDPSKRTCSLCGVEDPLTSEEDSPTSTPKLYLKLQQSVASPKLDEEYTIDGGSYLILINATPTETQTFRINTGLHRDDKTMTSELVVFFDTMKDPWSAELVVSYEATAPSEKETSEAVTMALGKGFSLVMHLFTPKEEIGSQSMTVYVDGKVLMSVNVDKEKIRKHMIFSTFKASGNLVISNLGF